MLKELESGYEAVGHVEGISTELAAAFLRLDDRGAVISVPEVRAAGDVFRGFANDREVEVPSSLRFHGTDGSVVLADCYYIGGSSSTRGPAFSRIRARRVIEGSGGVLSYDDVDGMTSEIDGLASWAGMSAVSTNVEFQENAGGGVKAVVLRAENQPAVVLGGKADARVETYFSHAPRPKGNVFAITDMAHLRTRSDSLWNWQQHAVVHRMFQDLMCLVFGQACLSRIASIKREDDQPNLDLTDHRRQWRKVYEPSFGRSVSSIPPLDRNEAQPLFRLADCDAVALAEWIDGWDLWSRSTWIAVTTMFQSGTPIESRLLQIGVALEALGFALWTEAEGGLGSTPSFPELLAHVSAAISIDHEELTGQDNSATWRAGFNNAYNGAKHADNSLPDAATAHDFAEQGLNLIRAWLGTRLGVSDQRLKEGLDRY